MKTLYESILDDEDENLDTMGDEILIKDFLSKNYKINGTINIKKIRNKCIVDVDGSVSLINKKLKNLTNDLFEFGIVTSYFELMNCTGLKTLKGAPKKCYRFDCPYCYNLISLEGGPKEVELDYICFDCTKLKSLKGAPEFVPRDFYCSGCPNIDDKVYRGPKRVGGDFCCIGCPNVIKYINSLTKKELEKLANSVETKVTIDWDKM